MNTKDWILLLVPIICNGIVIFVLQKIFEKRQLVLNEKYKYISVMQQKVDNALYLFMEVLQTTDNELEQFGWLNKFINSYCDIFYYYQQNQALFKSLKNYMDELLKIHEQIKNNQFRANNGVQDRIHIEQLFRRIYELLQSIQKDCINRKI